MENGNGTHANGAPITPEEFNSMTDAADKPTTTNNKKGKKPTTTTAPVAATEAPHATIPPEAIQAARDEIYMRGQVPAPLISIFNRLPPEEIVFIIAHVEHAYRSGMAAGAGAGNDGYERGKADAMLSMAKYSEIIAMYQSAIQELDREPPNTRGCLRIAEQAFRRIHAP